jgi:hypothetical protein
VKAIQQPAIVIARGRQLTVLSAVTIVLVVAVVVMSLVDLLTHDVAMGPPDRPSVLVSRAGDIANLLILSPALAITARMARTRHPVAVMALPGAVLYVIYVYALYLLTAPLTAALVGHLALVVLGAVTLFCLLISIDPRAARRHLSGAPSRPIAVVLVTLGSLSCIGLAVRMFLMTTAGPDANTRAQWVLDAALQTPPLLLAGLLLWFRRPWGSPLAVAALFLFALSGVIYGVAGLLDTFPGSPGTEPWVIATNFATSAISAVSLAVFVTWRSPREPTGPAR